MHLILLTLACNTDDAKTDDQQGTVTDDDGDGFSSEQGDCDDGNPDIGPDAQELCNDIDDNCDGEVDNNPADGVTGYIDQDQDGYGDPATASVACALPTGAVTNGDDCDDTDDGFHPGAKEDCTDPTDYNCDGKTQYADDDQDGWPACEECDDTRAEVNPDATEVACDGLDNDCEGTIDDSLRIPSDFATFAEAMKGATEGDRYCIETGTHTDPIDISGGVGVTFQGIGGPDAVRLEAGHAETTVNLYNTELTLEDMTIAGGESFWGAAIRVLTAGLTLNNVTIRDSVCAEVECEGAAVWMNSGNLDFSDVRFTENQVEATGSSKDFCQVTGGLLYLENVTHSGQGLTMDNNEVSISCDDGAITGALMYSYQSTVDWSDFVLTDNTVSTNNRQASVNGGLLSVYTGTTLSDGEITANTLDVVVDEQGNVAGGLIRSWQEVFVEGVDINQNQLQYHVDDGIVSVTGNHLLTHFDADIRHLDLRANATTTTGDYVTFLGGGITTIASNAKAHPILQNSIIAGNTMEGDAQTTLYGGAIYGSAYNGATYTIDHVDIVGNAIQAYEIYGGTLHTGDSAGGVMSVTASHIAHEQQRTTGGNTAGAVAFYYGDDSLDLWYSNLFGNTTKNAFYGSFYEVHNLSQDPLFLDVTASDPMDWDLRLDSKSPSIDMAAGEPDVDKTDGDIGAYGGPHGGW